MRRGDYYFCNFDRDKYDQASKQYYRAVKQAPAAPRPYWRLAKALSRSGDFEGSTKITCRLEALKRCTVGDAMWAHVLVECITGLHVCSGVHKI